MNKKLIAIDLDGTALDSRVTMHPYNVKVLKHLSALGHKVVIATGRPWRSTKEFYELLELDTPVCNYNGSYIHNPKDESFAQKIISIPKEMVIDIYQTLEPYIHNIMCELEDKVFLLRPDEKLDSFFWRDRVQVHIGKIDEILYTNPTTIIISTNDVSYNELVTKYIEEHYPNYICRFWGGTYDAFAEIYPKDVNKGIAIHYIAEQLKIDKDDIVAIGDASNDLELLQMATVGIAMKNGVPPLLLIADQITSHTCLEGGLGIHFNNLFALNLEY